ncbi:hypothetical protein DFP72DRAFT_852068 [Ephemerocybe angulata]|uniref:Uncharacterized protein n=1 Tax=Ephemerocybe angulata TaxID=980116 RepID=A0A8H6HN52_9AGAR|nr:hypothetical protein DFP72DRAFT_852068 [Tulosesus angulatus]
MSKCPSYLFPYNKDVMLTRIVDDMFWFTAGIDAIAQYFDGKAKADIWPLRGWTEGASETKVNGGEVSTPCIRALSILKLRGCMVHGAWCTSMIFLKFIGLSSLSTYTRPRGSYRTLTLAGVYPASIWTLYVPGYVGHPTYALDPKFGWPNLDWLIPNSASRIWAPTVSMAANLSA